MHLITNFSLILFFLIEFTTNNIHNVCEICTCDNLDKPITVHCDSKKLFTLDKIYFHSSIETLSFINNSLTFQSIDDLQKINNITSLKSLILLNNPLVIIPKFSLSNLVNLQLENTYLQSSLFPKSYRNSSKLQSIILSRNKLTKLLSDNFQSLSSLTKLVIDNSKIYSIEQNTFTSLSNTLQSISLISNSLTSAEFFSTLNNLLSINFDNNNFKQLPIEIIKPQRTKHFFFRYNKIQIIDELSPLAFWMKSNLSDINIYLNNNPFDCCQSRWFIYYLSSPKNLVKDSFNLTCASPSVYSGKRLIDLHADLMDCSNAPVNPANIHLAIIISFFFGVVILILVVVGTTLYRRNTHLLARQREYERIEGEAILSVPT